MYLKNLCITPSWKKKIFFGYKIQGTTSWFSGSYRNKLHIAPLTGQEEMQFGTLTDLEDTVNLLTKISMALPPLDIKSIN